VVVTDRLQVRGVRVVVGSGSIEAMAVLENYYHPDIEV